MKINAMPTTGADPRFQVRVGGGAHLKELRRAEEGAKIFGVFHVKNHDFTQKNYIFSNFRGGLAPGAPLYKDALLEKDSIDSIIYLN